MPYAIDPDRRQAGVVKRPISLDTARAPPQYGVERRFRQLPPELEARLAGADEPLLERMLDRLPSATRPDDLLER